MDELTNRIALVTGASRGIGRAIAVSLAAAGADVVVNYKSEEGRAQETCRKIREIGRRCVAVRADVSRSDDIARLVQTAERELGPISILVNNAGMGATKPLDQITEADWEHIIRVNLTSAFLLTQAVVPGMRQRRWGRIINISSVAAETGGVIGPQYAASKAGMHGLTHSYASLLAKEGITANAIAPALIETDMLKGLPPDAVNKIPVGRFGKSDEIADVAVMLAKNGYITGQTINVNGGWYFT